MKKTISFILERPARKKGADRYKASGHEDFSIYIPQDITRPSGSPLQAFQITFNDGGDS